MDQQSHKNLANTIRSLSIDAIDEANSGHPGLPLGCAEIAASLFGEHLRYNPKDPNWLGRDKFVLSAGHGSMLLYASLHLAGYDLSLNQIKNFRQLHSPTAGHPEYGEAPGIETTTGPLGQGIATATGLALANKLAAEQYDMAHLLTGSIIVLAGDGCMMEGISSESSSFAGHLNLDNLIVIYDSNDICLDGPISECFSENVEQRYLSYGWDVQTIDGHNKDDLDNAIHYAKSSPKPSLIIAKTTIGYGSPTFAGTSDVHGKALGTEESKKTKESLGISQERFHVSDSVKTEMKNVIKHNIDTYDQWMQDFNLWKQKHPNFYKKITDKEVITTEIQAMIEKLEIKPNIATRASSQAVIQELSKEITQIIGGSADLSCSDSTYIKHSGHVTQSSFNERNIKYGVREFSMGAIATGLSLSGFFKPFCGTFLTFSDYMKNAIRLAALMKQNVIYQFTHDSILLGEDGPTHQPVEHLASLRSIPGLTVIRPADSTEVKGAWLKALEINGPVALILSRQGVPDLESTSIDGLSRGGYILHEASKSSIDYCILSTGSEVSLALDTASTLEAQGKSVRVVSIPSFELFKKQGQDYIDTILGDASQYVSIEAQSSFGWHQFVGRDGITISVDEFGLSAPAKDLAEEYGFTVEKIINRLTK